MSENRNELGQFSKREELTIDQLQAIATLIENGGNKAKTCKDLKLNRATLYNWFDNELFVQEYRKACDRLYTSSLAKALDKLNKQIDSKDSRTALKAVENILKLNGYLSAKLDVQQNTTENFIITLINETEEDE